MSLHTIEWDGFTYDITPMPEDYFTPDDSLDTYPDDITVMPASSGSDWPMMMVVTYKVWLGVVVNGWQTDEHGGWKRFWLPEDDKWEEW